jgi:hypothetical protein
VVGRAGQGQGQLNFSKMPVLSAGTICPLGRFESILHIINNGAAPGEREAGCSVVQPGCEP